MTKHITFLLLFTFLFTACVERGQALSPNNLTLICTQKATSTVTEKKKSKKNNSVTKEVFTQKDIEKNKLSTNKVSSGKANIDYVEKNGVDTISNDQENFFTLTEKTKNKISGFFVIVIGVMIFL